MTELNEAFRLLGIDDFQKKGQLVTLCSEVNIIPSAQIHRYSKEKKEEFYQIWAKHIASHPKDFDGHLVSLKNITLEGGGPKKTVNLFVRPTLFSIFLATKEIRQGKRLKIATCRALDAEYPLPLSVGPITLTSDGYIVYSERQGTFFEDGQVNFLPSGYIDPFKARLRGQGIISFREAVFRELREEVGLPNKGEIIPLGIVQSLSGSCQPLIAGVMKIPFTAKEVDIRTRSRAAAEEVKEVKFVHADIESLKKFCETHSLCAHDEWKIGLFVAMAY